MSIWGPLAVFVVSLVLDYSTSAWAIKRGLREGNPVLRANPILVALISAGIVIGLAEGFRTAGYANWQPIYWVGSGVHILAAAWNLTLILRGAK